MSTIDSNTFPYLCSQQFKILHLNVIEKRNKLLVERDSAHHLLEIGAVQLCTLFLSDITAIIGGCLAHSVNDSSNKVRRQLVMPNVIRDGLDVDSGKHHILTREVSDTETL